MLAAKKDIVLYPREIATIKTEAEKITVTNDEEAAFAADLIKRVKEIGDDIKAKKDALTAPLKEHIEFIKSGFDVGEGLLKDIERIVKAKAGSYMQEQKRIKEEAEQKRREEATAALTVVQETLETKAVAENSEHTLNQAVKIEQTINRIESKPIAVSSSVKTGSATMTTRKLWKHEVIDPSLVPREYCMPSSGLLRDAVNGGKREIPGVRIYEESSVSVK